jgi:hypothetical protein
MHKLDQIAGSGEGLLPELRSFYQRLARDPYAECVIRSGGMIQSGPDPASESLSAGGPDDARPRETATDTVTVQAYTQTQLE